MSLIQGGKSMPFDFQKTKIPDVVHIKPKIFGDERGFFMEIYKQSDFRKEGINVVFVQVNYSKSTYGVIRGLHYQKEPFAQSKLVRCVKGKILDVAVDIRKKSETFGKYVSVELTDENKHMLFIPKGFAHGFQVLSDEAEIEYLVDAEYTPEYECGILWNDSCIGIKWSIQEPFLSKKDLSLCSFLSLNL